MEILERPIFTFLASERSCLRHQGLPEGWKRVLVTFILVDLSVLVEPILETNKSIAKSFSLDASASSLNATPYTCQKKLTLYQETRVNFMTERRKSSRPAVIEKGRQLEEKLRSRENKKEIRAAKATSKSLDNLTNPKSLNLNQAKDTCSSQSEAGSAASLEWDNSEETITLQNIDSPEKSDASFLSTVDEAVSYTHLTLPTILRV